MKNKMVEVSYITKYLDIDFDTRNTATVVSKINQLLDSKIQKQEQSRPIISQSLLNMLDKTVLPAIEEEPREIEMKQEIKQEIKQANNKVVMNTDIQIIPYNEKSFVVRGGTMTYKDSLIKLGGRWNKNLQGGEGWIFSNKALKNVEEFFGKSQPKIYIDIKDGRVVVSGDYKEFDASLRLNGGIPVANVGFVFDIDKLGTVKTILGIKAIDRSSFRPPKFEPPEFKQPARQNIQINNADKLLVEEMCKLLKQSNISKALKIAEKISDSTLNFFAEICVYTMKNIRDDNKLLLCYRFFETILKGGAKFDFIKNNYMLSISDYLGSLRSWVKQYNLQNIDIFGNISGNMPMQKPARPVQKPAQPTQKPAQPVQKPAVTIPLNSSTLVPDPSFRCKPNPKYEKDCQKYPEPDEDDPILIFYKSLYEEDENSPLAITWLTEYGVFEDREELLEKYIQLGREGKLIKLKR